MCRQITFSHKPDKSYDVSLLSEIEHLAIWHQISVDFGNKHEQLMSYISAGVLEQNIRHERCDVLNYCDNLREKAFFISSANGGREKRVWLEIFSGS